MSGERCDRSGLLVDQCGCPHHRGPLSMPAGRERAHPPPDYEGERPPKEAILVHISGRAHWYGCQHLPEYEYLVPPTWGWIVDAKVWQRIGNHAVRATAGNTELVATVRCLDCS